MSRILQAIDRANSHVRYWRYRRLMKNGGPSLWQTLKDWRKRFAFELRNLKD